MISTNVNGHPSGDGQSQHGAAREDLRQQLQMNLCSDSVAIILYEASLRRVILGFCEKNWDTPCKYKNKLT